MRFPLTGWKQQQSTSVPGSLLLIALRQVGICPAATFHNLMLPSRELLAMISLLLLQSQPVTALLCPWRIAITHGGLAVTLQMESVQSWEQQHRSERSLLANFTRFTGAECCSNLQIFVNFALICMSLS
jgi:hypothetical protein